ncbi:MAG TPA: Sec-independent protein translocase protein TatB [Casimicrobiaceae bacterium]|jgi:sec-independent protein translocase protein TatB|nr:Sec-independent protein translocase protein TatB [Casimicrobiaceae bacterium]
MFDIAFSEIVVIAVVALIVIGPERLPKVARTLGHMFGRLQRYVNEVKADINREMELDELRKLRSEVQSAASEFESSIHKAAQEVDSGVRSVETELNEAGKPPSESPPAPAPGTGAAATSPGAPAPTGEETPRQTALPGFDRI